MALADPTSMRTFAADVAEWLEAGEEYRRRTAEILEPYGCVYCERHAETFDHVVPRSKGGSDDPVNLVPSCRPCNASKKDRPIDVWAESLEDFAANGEKAASRAVRAREVARWAGDRILTPLVATVAETK